MRKWTMVLCLIMILLALAPQGLAAEPFSMKRDPFYALMQSYVQAHRQTHQSGGSLGLREINLAGLTGAETRLIFPGERPQSLLNCLLFSNAFPMDVPTDADGLIQSLDEVMSHAFSLADNTELATTMDAKRVQALMDAGDVSWAIAEPNLWTLYDGDGGSPEIIAPFVIFNTDTGEVYDKWVYLMVINSSPDASQIWVFSEPAIVRDYVARLPIDPDRGAINAFLLGWMVTPPPVPERAQDDAVPSNILEEIFDQAGSAPATEASQGETYMQLPEN